MSYAVCRRAQDRAPTFRVVVYDTASIYRGIDFTLAVYAVDENGCHLNVSGTALLTLNNADASDALDDNGSALTTITITNGVWASSTVAIDGGSGPETDVSISCSATGYTDGTSDSFNLIEFGVEEAIDVRAIVGNGYNNHAHFAYDGTYLWYTGYHSSNDLIKVLATDFTSYTLYTTKHYGAGVYPLNIITSDGTYLYLTGEHNNEIVTIRLSDMTEYAAAAFKADSDNLALGGGKVYTSRRPFTNSWINEITVPALTNRTETETLNCGDCNRWVVDSAAGYLYRVGGRALSRIRISDKQREDYIDLSDYVYNGNYGLCVYDDDYIYVTSAYDMNGTKPSKSGGIAKIRKSDLTLVDEYYASSKARNSYAIGLKDGYLYLAAVANLSSRNFMKIKASDMSEVFYINVSAYVTYGEYPDMQEIFFDDMYAYVPWAWSNYALGGWSYQRKILRIAK